MIEKTIIEQKIERNLFIALFFISIILSNVGIPSIENAAMMPNYFIALITAFTLNNNSFLNIYILVIIGLIVDIFVGELLGQYGLIFICIYLVHFIIQKILVIKSTQQIFSLSFFLIISSFLVLWTTSVSHGLFISFNLVFIQSILTFIAYLIFNIFIKKFTKN